MNVVNIGSSFSPGAVDSTLSIPARSFEERLYEWANERIPGDEPIEATRRIEDRNKAARTILERKSQNSTNLSLSGLKIGGLPQCLSEMELIKRIFINHCGIKELRSELLPRNLEALCASNNEISSFDLKNCEKIKTLSISFNKLKLVNSEFFPRNLESLVAEENQLTTITLTAPLSLLNLSNNQLSGILDCSSIQNFATVRLEGNHLSFFPIFSAQTRLHELKLQGNPIEVFPADEYLPHVTFYSGNLPNSEAGRVRLGRGDERESFVPKPPGLFISPVAFFQGVPPQIGVAGFSRGAVMGTKLPQFVKNLGGEPVSINLGGPEEVHRPTLTAQVQQGVLKLRSERRRIPVALVEEAAPESSIGKIRAYAEKEIKKVQALILPGGENIQREFYDESATISLYPWYSRTVVEFALVLAAKKQGKPVYGICRGAQLLNVLFGGTLKDQPQSGWSPLEVAESSHKQMVVKLLEGDSISAFSCHEQCCDQIAKGFEVVMTSGTIPKFIMNIQDKMFGSQMHLEEMWENEYSVGYRLLQLFCAAVAVNNREQHVN